jgi:hypothetical protein
MIVSHKHRFVFLKTRKTAGTSLEIALSRQCGPDDIITPISDEDEVLRRELGGKGPQNWESMPGRRAVNHMPASGARRLVGPEVWDEYFKFAVERNPWDQVASSYRYSNRRPEWNVPFGAFVRSRRLEKLAKNQHIYRLGGQVAVDRVCLFESLVGDLAEVCDLLGLPPMELPHAKASPDRRHYRELYDPSDVEVVRRVFSDTIDTFGYEF